nr:MAG TPA: hypothetical protein [Caudoviricetes sp.]
MKERNEGLKDSRSDLHVQSLFIFFRRNLL